MYKQQKHSGQTQGVSIQYKYIADISDHSEEELEAHYEEIDKALKAVKSDEILIIMGDWNAKIGNGKYENIVGKYGLGKRNTRGERLIKVCEQKGLTVTNTFFQQPERRLYTWKSPGDVTRNQIHYILVKKRFKKRIKQCITYPGADIGSDHNAVVATMKVKLKALQKSKKKEPIVDVGKLNITDVYKRNTPLK